MSTSVRSGILVLAILSSFCGPGLSRDVERVDGGLAGGSVAGAEVVTGISCTLRADRTTWSFGERPRLKVYITSPGRRKLWLATIAEQHCVIEIDGKVMRWAEPLWTDAMMQIAQSSWLAESGAYLTVTVDERLLRGLDGSKVSELRSGDHTIVFGWAGCESNPADGSARRDKPIIMTSNKVRISVTKPAPNGPIRIDDRRSLVRELFESYVHPTPLTEAEKKLGLKTELQSYHFWMPRFKWSDIGTLLDLAAGDRAAGRIPSLMISSYAQRDCREGMIALWLIEGMRRKQVASDKRPDDAPALWYLPPLNPICTSEGVGVRNGETSATIHGQVLDRYRLWWRKVSSLEQSEAASYDPLVGTKLQWYGSGPGGKSLEE